MTRNLRERLFGRRGLAALGVVSAGLLAIGFGASSCVGEEGLEAYACPNPAVFTASVSPYLERRCGTLDCHGQATRPMRIYGQLGLRHPLESNVSGGAATTQLELESNFAAVCNLDPAAMQQVVDDLGSTADKLLLVNKARGLERHKGGKIVNEQDPGDLCILGWLGFKDAATVDAACTAAIEPLK
ncbi:hypothetical protein [Polyangium spumosum]|uniref:Lipoprotein n=1 Tax=Polyangium spumosum TaxID=889282 RepID=A0A6N7PTE4_9BACT|nr:hypothetical protein [Polyangium spumosum]MRG93525.1 hypothetical protein [Polyangium spumosum]